MIITIDKDENICIGDLKVKKREELKEFRDYLMNESFGKGKFSTYKILSDVNKSTLSDLFVPGSFKKGDALVVHKELASSSQDEICEYNEKVISSYYLNSILIFTSLLGEIDSSSVSPIAQKFIQNGIFRCDSFDKIWEKCSREILDKGSKNDLIAFKAALEGTDSAICYDVSRVISKEESQHGGVMRGVDANALNQIHCNSKILLDNSLVRSKSKR